MSDAIAIANRWITAYNAKDMNTLRGLMSDDLYMEHHNRNAVFKSAQAALDVMNAFAAIAPDRRFHSIRKQTSDGRTVVTELIWEATPNVDLPGFGEKNKTIRLDLACVWTVRDGRICEYHDYG